MAIITPPPFPSPVAWHNASYEAIDPALPGVSAKGKTVVVTGAGAGIGLAIAKAFAKAGATRVAILARTEKALVAAQKAIESLYPDTAVSIFTADVASETSIVEAFGSIKSNIGKVDILISNAGYLPDIESVDDISVDEWWRGYEVNVRGTFIVGELFQKCGPHFFRDVKYLALDANPKFPTAKKALASLLTDDAVVINITSGIATLPFVPGYSSYASSKIASIKLFEYLQQEYPTRHFVSIHPGVIATAMDDKTIASGTVLPKDDSKAWFIDGIS
jgi:NAD(P)-dependent dehydrogenase (short-subunit alcohol dehydrogenase family)